MISLRSTILLALAAVSSAIQVTTPSKDTVYDLSKDNQVIWSSVSTDPTSFSLYLVNNAAYPPVSIKIADGVATSDNKYTIAGGSLSAAAGPGYQISLQSVIPLNTGILAMSNQFNITGAGSSTTSSASTSSTSSHSTSTSSTTGVSTIVTSVAVQSTTTAAPAATTASNATFSITAGPGAATSIATFPGAAPVNAASGFATVGFVGLIAALFM